LELDDVDLVVTSDLIMLSLVQLWHLGHLDDLVYWNWTTWSQCVTCTVTMDDLVLHWSWDVWQWILPVWVVVLADV